MLHSAHQTIRITFVLILIDELYKSQLYVLLDKWEAVCGGIEEYVYFLGLNKFET